jgi:glutaredoxin
MIAMKLAKLLNASCLTLSAVLASAAHAELYKWVGADGKVTYSDVAPPANAKQVEKRALSGGTSGVTLPTELAAAVEQNPVTLYVTKSCAPCDEGRALLKQRGVPFSEKTISNNEDVAKLKQVSGDAQLPLLLISNSKFRGFDRQVWNQSLSNAGYPESSMLPKEYRYPAVESAAPAAAAPAPAAKKNSEKPKPVPQRNSETESGIRF